MFVRNESFSDFVRFYPVVTILFVTHIILYLLMLIPLSIGDLVFEHLVGVNLLVAKGEIWRLVTPIFLHKGFAHLLFNSFSLILFGPGLERILGKGRFFFVYLSAGVLANIATFFIKPLTYIHLGASGAIFGLFGYYIAMIVFQKNSLSQSDRQIIVPIAVIGVIMTFIQPNINITAHLFGLLAGFLLGGFALKKI